MDDFIPFSATNRGGTHRGASGGHTGYNNGRRGHHGRGGGGRWGGRGRGRGRGDRGRGRGRGNGGRAFQRIAPSFDSMNESPIEEIGHPSPQSLSIAIEGCCHGELDNIYRRLKDHERDTGRKLDLLICCGDFQSLRNAADFHSSSIPPKYRSLGTFPQYYSGEKTAPILTLFIGGNHEASQPLRELHYGGWVAPNIYYLGAAGVVNIGGIRIGGISGIYKSHDYTQGHFERPPFDRSSLRSVYHVRNVDVYRMKCLSRDRLDVLVSHDWPLGIEQHGNTSDLLKRKPFFRAEVQSNTLGSPPNREILDAIQPKWWFSAHLHVKFNATVSHGPSKKSSTSDDRLSLVPSQVPTSTTTKRSKELKDETTLDKTDTSIPKDDRQHIESNNVLDSTSEGDGTENVAKTEFRAFEGDGNCGGLPDLTNLMTKFLALDKCLPRRNYLSILHLPMDRDKSDLCLEYDMEWLAVLKKTHEMTSGEKRHVSVPNEVTEISDSDIDWIRERLNARRPEKKTTAISTTFHPTVPFYNDPIFHGSHTKPFPFMGNPQTDDLLELLELDHIITTPYKDIQLSLGGNNQSSGIEEDDNEIDIDSDSGRDEVEQNDVGNKTDNFISAVGAVEDDNEIAIDSDDDEEEDEDEDEEEAKVDKDLDERIEGGSSELYAKSSPHESQSTDPNVVSKKVRLT